MHFKPAFVAGVIEGILWQSAGWAFAVFVASSTQYAAIYGIYASFAVFVLFLIWLYVGWLVLLFSLPASVQNVLTRIDRAVAESVEDLSVRTLVGESGGLLGVDKLKAGAEPR